MTVWSDFQKKNKNGSAAGLKILEIAVRCSYNKEFKNCVCGLTFAGQSNDANKGREKANREKHSKAAIDFIAGSVVKLNTAAKHEDNGFPWGRKRGIKILQRMNSVGSTQEDVFSLLDDTFCGVWAAALIVLAQAGRAQKLQLHKGGPKMKPEGKIYFVDERRKWEKGTNKQMKEYCLLDSGVIGKFVNYVVHVGGESYTKTMAICAGCGYEKERSHDVRKHYRNAHGARCARHGVCCSSHKSTDGSPHEVALHTMSPEMIRELKVELDNPGQSEGWQTWGIADLHKVVKGQLKFLSGSGKSRDETAHGKKRKGQNVQVPAKRAKYEELLVEQAVDDLEEEQAIGQLELEHNEQDKRETIHIEILSGDELNQLALKYPVFWGGQWV